MARAQGNRIVNQRSDSTMPRNRMEFTGVDLENLSGTDSDYDPLQEPETTETTYSTRSSFGQRSRDSSISSSIRITRLSKMSGQSTPRTAHTSEALHSDERQSFHESERHTFVDTDDDDAKDHDDLWLNSNEFEMIENMPELEHVVVGAASLLRNRTDSGGLPDYACMRHSHSASSTGSFWNFVRPSKFQHELEELKEQKDMEKKNIARLAEAKAKLE